MIKLDVALAGVTRLGLDTPPFIYFVERNPAYLNLVREAIRRIDSGAISGYSSVVTLTETLTLPMRVGNRVVENEYRALLLSARNFALLPIDAHVADVAADLRARYNLRTPDALQVAAALQVHCEAFLTNDAQLARVTELRVLVLDELEL